MKCVVTAGPAFEPLDQVRRLTNFSTGQLGCELAGYLSGQGHEVVLLKGYYSVFQGPANAAQVSVFTTTEDLQNQLHGLASSTIHALFHAAAVSDFRFGKVFARQADGKLVEAHSGKYGTRQGPLLAELIPTPKIIASLRSWYPEAWIAGWKYEVDGSRADCIAAGSAQLKSCATNVCVVNGPAYGPGFGLVLASGSSAHLDGKEALFRSLAEAMSAE